MHKILLFAAQSPSKKTYGLFAAVLSGFLLANGCLLSGIAHAETPATTDTVAAEQTNPLDARVEQKVGSLLRQAYAAHRVSAAELVYVRDGKVRIAEGFGYEDPGQTTPVTTSESRFLVNSISKTFVAVAVAQLKSRGLIANYDDPVNRYLKSYQLPASGGRQITIEQLATHTAGIDVSAFGLSTDSPVSSQLRPADYDVYRPPYFMVPGLLPVYSTYGVDLLALTVADISGKRFSAYAQEAILRPLGMTRTLAEYPGGAIPHLVQAFLPDDSTRVVATEFKRPMTFPDSGFISTGDDMGRYLLALLDRDGAQQVISAAMQDDMFRMHHQVLPSDVGYGLLFERSRVRTRDVIYHRGGGSGIVCNLAMSPTDRAGLFECIAEAVPSRFSRSRLAPLSPNDVDQAVFDGLIDEEGTAAATDGNRSAASESWNESWNAYLGDYVWTAHHHFGIGRLTSILHPEDVRVERGASGLKIAGTDGFTENSQGHFTSPNMVESFTFFSLPGYGRRLLSRSLNATSFEYPSLLDDPHFMSRLLAVLIAVSVTGILWPLWPAARRNNITCAAAALFGLCMLGGAACLLGLHALGFRYNLGEKWPLALVRTCGFACVPISVVLIAACFRVPGTAPRGIGSVARTHLILLAAGAAISVAALISLGVIGFLIR